MAAFPWIDTLEWLKLILFDVHAIFVSVVLSLSGSEALVLIMAGIVWVVWRTTVLWYFLQRPSVQLSLPAFCSEAGAGNKSIVAGNQSTNPLWTSGLNAKQIPCNIIPFHFDRTSQIIQFYMFGLLLI